MKDGPDIARVAALIGDPARANMLTALMHGKALTATELSGEAGVTLPTASTHLSKLDAGGLLRVRKQGRHKYFSLASDDVAGLLEALMGFAAGAGHLRTRTGPRDEGLRKARVCYNHLAGEMGTAMYDAMVLRGYLHENGDDLTLTVPGEAFARDFGIAIEPLIGKRPPLCRQCLDWSARRNHLGGSLGRAMLTRIEDLGWARRIEGTRIIDFTPEGTRQFTNLFKA